MPLEEIRPGIDEFPVGMRVLAVDDDPTCLMVLGGLLRKCQYQVTTTTDAKTALEMLRIDRKRFDLVISDVYMPDMDGFRLLELIGLEMDLPVIMLSANSDPKLVMKGINHGAVDYLVKPVRIEELRNIWQHVIRRKKVQPKEQNKNPIKGMSHQGNQEGRIQDESNGNEQRGKRSRKRKEEEEEENAVEEEESEGNGTENEDPSSHKKPRVVWSKPLHKKFLAAVEQLGMKNAVPKKILEMMNVEGISRENVASHLQKYRSFIKRINNSVANEQMQANMIAAYMQDRSSYAPTNPLNGLGSFPRQQQSIHQASGSLHSSLLPPYQTSPVLARANTPSVSLQSGGVFGNQPTHSRNSLDYSLPNASGNPLLPQGTQLQRQSGGVFGNQPTHSRNSLDCPLPNASGNPLLPQGTLQGTQLQRQSGGVFGNQHFLSSNPKPLMTGFNGDWQMTLPPSNLLPNTMPLSEPFGHNNQSNALHFPATMPERCYNPNQRLSDSNSMVPSCLGMGQFSESLGQNNVLWGRNTDSSFVGQSDVDALPLQQFDEIERLVSGSLTGSSKDHHSDQMNSQQGGFLYSGCDFFFDELLNAETKPVQGTVSMNPGGFDFDAYSF